MIITWQLVLAAAGGFVCIVTALEKLQDIIRKAKKPVKDVDEKLARDYDRLNALDKELKELKEVLDYVKDSLMLLMENDLVTLEHMRTNNSTGKISEREDVVKHFLLEHQQKN